MRRLRVGVLDLMTQGPTRSLWGRLMQPNFASIMPQVVAVWCEEAGHDVRFVCYTGNEDLTREPEPVIRRIIAACGLAWHPACLRPESNPRAVRTPSKWQTRQPIYRTSVARWKRYEPWLGPLRALVDNASEPRASIARL